jgi:two-component system sensor histidine kinase HydH
MLLLKPHVKLLGLAVGIMAIIFPVLFPVTLYGPSQQAMLASTLTLLAGGIVHLIMRKAAPGLQTTVRHGGRISGKEYERLFMERTGQPSEHAGGSEEQTQQPSENDRDPAGSMRLMEGILSNMSGGVLLLGMDGTVKLINLQGAQMLRCKRENVIGRNLAESVPGTAAFMDADSGSYREIELHAPDGTNIPIGFSSTYYYGANGEHEGVIVDYRDLTEIKALQSELISKEGFAAMGKVVAGVAHEIKNPLFGISSIAQIFERELEKAEHKELARALLSETRRLNQLVEELLIYGRPMNLTLDRCDLRRLWQEVFELHKKEIEKKSITITGDFNLRPPVAYLDARQIRQVFLNLLRNSLEATARGGEINIKLLLEDRYIIFKIADTGAGIPANIMGRVFDLFFTTKPKGTGLGLAICRKIVHDHGGEITIESMERKGTTVTVRLPYRGEPKDSAMASTK